MTPPMLDGGQGRDAPDCDAVWRAGKWLALVVVGWFVLMLLGGGRG